MAVSYRRLPADISRDRESVSDAWYWVLMELRHRGYRFNINEGHRTMARQAELGRQLGWYPNGFAGFGTGAARPSPTAPHIRVGRSDHAVDADGVTSLMAGLSKLGIHNSRPVPGEAWHVEVNAADLLRVAKALKAKANRIAKLQAQIRRVSAQRKKSYRNKNWKWWKIYAARVKALQKKLKGMK